MERNFALYALEYVGTAQQNAPNTRRTMKAAGNVLKHASYAQKSVKNSLPFTHKLSKTTN